MASATTSTALQVVVEYHRRWTSGHVEQAMALLADDFSCQAPVGELGKEAYREYLAGFVPRLTGVVDVAHFASDDHVVLIYYPQTATTCKAAAAEYFTVRDGVIAGSLLIFDRLAYAPPAE